MELFLMTLTTGIMVGGIYALVALGWVLIYKCSGVLNLAMGEMTLIGAYVTLSFHAMGVPFLLALLFSLIIGFILGILTERIFLDRLIGEPVLTVIMVTVGLSFFFKGTLELIWGTDTRVFTPPVFSIEPIRIGTIVVGSVYLWSFVAAIILLVIFVCFFKYTRWGLAMQATADDEMAALSLGVSARFVYATAGSSATSPGAWPWPPWPGQRLSRPSAALRRQQPPPSPASPYRRWTITATPRSSPPASWPRWAPWAF